MNQETYAAAQAAGRDKDDMAKRTLIAEKRTLIAENRARAQSKLLKANGIGSGGGGGGGRGAAAEAAAEAAASADVATFPGGPGGGGGSASGHSGAPIDTPRPGRFNPRAFGPAAVAPAAGAAAVGAAAAGAAEDRPHVASFGCAARRLVEDFANPAAQPRRPFNPDPVLEAVTRETHGESELLACQLSNLTPEFVASAGGAGAFVARVAGGATGADKPLWRCPANCAPCINAALKKPLGPGCVNKVNGNYLDKAACGANNWCVCQRPFAYDSKTHQQKRRRF